MSGSPSHDSPVEVVGAERLDDLAALEPVAEAIFGRGDRQPRWFARKLIREGVEPRLSSLLIRTPASDVGPEPEPVGYALVGSAPSRPGVVRGAGVGVAPDLRGRGHGGQLLVAARERARAAGFAAIEFLAEPARLDWYRRHGYEVVEEQLTLVAPGLGPPGATLRVDLDAPPVTPRPTSGATAWSWIPEHWDRTPARERAYREVGGVHVWLTREGRAWLVHRCELADAAALIPGLTDLRRQLEPSAPLLLYPCPADAHWLADLYSAGFGAAQRSFVVRRGTG